MVNLPFFVTCLVWNMQIKDFMVSAIHSIICSAFTFRTIFPSGKLRQDPCAKFAMPTFKFKVSPQAPLAQISPMLFSIPGVSSLPADLWQSLSSAYVLDRTGSMSKKFHGMAG